jgi:CBS domain-containing protein
MAQPALELAISTPSGAVLGPSNEPWQVDLKDPAVSVMTDFRVRSLFKIEPKETIDEALQKMKVAGVRIAFILEKETDRLLGIITAYDIMGEKPMRFLQSVGFDDRAVTRKDVRVEDLMEPVESWAVADMRDVERMNVKAVLDALQKCGRTHLPVVESASGGPVRLRGLFSSAKMLRLTEYSRLKAAQSKQG